MLPEIFIQRLEKIVPKKHYKQVYDSFQSGTACYFRINTLKASKDDIFERLHLLGLSITQFSFNKEVFAFQGDKSLLSDLISSGKIYQQNFSSVLVSLILDPKEHEVVLDLCAAPGSKTSHIAALMNNTGKITALEVVRKRYYKLKSVLELLGVTNTDIKCIDARRFNKEYQILFDKILVDAPCSSEGRFSVENKKTFLYWSIRKIREMRKKQKGLLMHAFRCLKPGGTLIYSTCTFAPEENEEVVSWLIKKFPTQAEIISMDIKGIETYPAILNWNDKEYNSQCRKCARILPGEHAGGFFITKIRKNKDEM